MPKPSIKRQRVSSSRTSPATWSRSTSKSSDVVDDGNTNCLMPLPRVRKTSNADGAIRVTVVMADSASKELDDTTPEPCEAQMAEPTAASELACDTNDEQSSEQNTHASVKQRRTSASIERDARVTSDTSHAAIKSPVSATAVVSELLDGDHTPEDRDAVETTPVLDDAVPTTVAVDKHDEPAVEQQEQRSDEPVDVASRSPDAPAAAAGEEDATQSLAQHELNGDSVKEQVGRNDEPLAQQELDGDDKKEPVDQDADVEMHCDDDSSNDIASQPLDAKDHVEVVETELVQSPKAVVETALVRDEPKEFDDAKDDATAVTMDTDDKENDCNGYQSRPEKAQAVESLHQSPLHDVCNGSATNDDTTTLDKPEQPLKDVPQCKDPLPASSTKPQSDAPTEPKTQQQSILPAKRKSKAAAKKRSAKSSVSLASTRHLFQFTCKLLQSQRLEFEVRAREVEEKRAALATTREKWEKRIRSVKRQLRDFGHPVDEVEASSAGPAAAPSASSSDAVNGSSSANGRASAPPSTAASASDPLVLTASGDWSSALTASDGAATSLITMRDVFSTRQHSGAATATSGSNGVDSHFPASIQTLETQIRDSLASRKRMVHDMLQDLEGGRRPSEVAATRPR